MNRLRNRLILVFLAATLAPLGVTWWITTLLLEQSLSFSSTTELDELSRSLQLAGKEYYLQAGENLKQDAGAGRSSPRIYSGTERAKWPETVRGFFESGEGERFSLSGPDGNRLDYLVRKNSEVWVYTANLEIGMKKLSDQIRDARAVVQGREAHDLRRGFKYTYVLLATSVWLVSLIGLIFLAHRISRPIQQLTAGLSQLAAGELSTRVPTRRNDEIGRAIQAFNHMAARLQQSTHRLIYLTQLSSWQSLARKMAHEVKNSLTPIRLTVEEMVARQSESDRGFMEQAAQIVVEEIESLERRVRAFSDFAAEPPVNTAALDVNALLEERVALLKSAHPEVSYRVQLAEGPPSALADADLIKGVLTNLLENAAQAVGEGGCILGTTSAADGKVAIEIHDSGPGLTEQIQKHLFQPTISFKKGGMGLGLSIARKSALLSGGDIELVKGELGGAGFRVVLPIASNGYPARSDRG